MKTSLVVVLGTAILLATSAATAQDFKVPVPGAKAKVQPSRSMDTKAQLEQMNEYMEKMRALHKKMIGAVTSDARQKLMEEQHKAVKDGMRLMNQMMDGMSGGGVLGQRAATRDPNGPIQMMQIGVDTMALMTQIMMDQLGLMTPPADPSKAPTK